VPAQLRHELQHRRKSGPELRQRHAQGAQPDVPHCADSQRILTLRDEPILQRALGQPQMLFDLHVRLSLLFDPIQRKTDSDFFLYPNLMRDNLPIGD